MHLNKDSSLECVDMWHTPVQVVVSLQESQTNFSLSVAGPTPPSIEEGCWLPCLAKLNSFNTLNACVVSHDVVTNMTSKGIILISEHR